MYQALVDRRRQDKCEDDVMIVEDDTNQEAELEGQQAMPEVEEEVEVEDPEVDRYRSPHEPRHHWQLKRRFMRAHRDSIPLKELAGMAQTLGNIQFLGCRYPPETEAKVGHL